MTEFVTPQLRTVLKTYQDSATKSLHGPGNSLVHSLKKELLSPDGHDDDDPPPMPLPPEIPQPILSTADTEPGVLYETILEGKPIGCFLLGGEMRLCIPQILNNVLNDFSLDEINRIFDEQRIFCSTCTPEQLHEFKAAKILPEDVNTAGLITRTNAERLCSALLHRSSDRRRHLSKSVISFRVFHRCFGKTEGRCIPELYSWKDPACIECRECYGLFSPQQFVCHVHKQENGTLHWGFDSTNWRAYVRVGSGSAKVDAIEEDEGMIEKYGIILDEIREQQLRDAEEAALMAAAQAAREIATLKRKIDPDAHSPVPRHRHHSPSSLPPTPAAYTAPSTNAACKQELLDIPLKKAKHLDDPYYNIDYRQAYLLAQYPHSYAFRPWAPLGPPPHHPIHSSKHAHHPHAPILHHPHHPHHMPPPPHSSSNLLPAGHHLPYAHHVAAAIAAAGPNAQMPYRGQEPPLLQNPERVVLHSESEQFERTFQPNVALQPRKPTQPPPPPTVCSPVSNPSEPCHSRDRERELEQRLSPLEVHIKLERPATPLEDEPMDEPPPPHHHRHDDDDTRSHHRLHSISPSNCNDSPSPPPPASPLCPNSIGQPDDERHHLHDARPLSPPTPPLQTTPPQPQPTPTQPTPPLSSHCGDTPSPPIPSPEGHSGSNEITSSTSPVPAATSSKLHRNNNPNHADNRDSISGDDHRQSSPNPTKPLLGEANHIHHHHHLLLHNNGSSALEMSTTGSGGGGHNKLSSELELSTDTDDDSLVGEPDSSNNNPIWDSVVEALKDTHAPDRERVLQVVKQLLAESAASTAECVRLRQELRRRDHQISELKLGPVSSDEASSFDVKSTTTTAATTTALPPSRTNGFQTPADDRSTSAGAMMSTTATATTTSTTKAVAEVIRMPLKKSLRCSMDGDHAIVRSTTHIGLGRLRNDSSADDQPIVRTADA